jgi:hypothetical protein
MHRARVRSRRTAKTVLLLGVVVLLEVILAAAVDSSRSTGVFLKDAGLLLAQAALPVMLLVALGLRWGDWRPSGSPLEAERERRLQNRTPQRPRAGVGWTGNLTYDEDFDQFGRAALAEALPEPLALARLCDVTLVFADDVPDEGAAVRWQPSAPHPSGGPLTGGRIVIYREPLRKWYGHDASLLRAAPVRAMREALSHNVNIEFLTSLRQPKGP